MNNSRIVLNNQDSEFDRVPVLREREGTLVKIIDSIRNIAKSYDWQILRNEDFDGLVETLERRIKEEAGKEEIDTATLYRLQGQLAWARKYSNLDKLAEFYELQLKGLRSQLKGNEN